VKEEKAGRVPLRHISMLTCQAFEQKSETCIQSEACIQKAAKDESQHRNASRGLRRQLWRTRTMSRLKC